MKKCCVLFLLLLPALLMGQAYQPFPDSGAVWHEHFVQPPLWDGHYQFGLSGDTLLGGKVYHKMYHGTADLTDSLIVPAAGNLVGALREDSLKRVFFYDMGLNTGLTVSGQVYQLYDFSAEPGDTVDFGEGYAFDYMILESVDSVWITDHYRKRFNFGGSSWIEGIGSNAGLFFALLPVPLCSCTRELICYKMNDATLYLAPGYSSCYDLLTGIETPRNPSHSAVIMPNPVSSTAVLDLSDLADRFVTIEFYDMLGQKLREYAINGKDKIIIDRNDFKSGICFYRLIRSDGQCTVNGKFVVR